MLFISLKQGVNVREPIYGYQILVPTVNEFPISYTLDESLFLPLT